MTEPVERFWTDVWSQGQVDVLPEILHRDATENGEPMDLDGFGRMVVGWRELFPDFTAKIEELLTTGEGRVVSRVTYTGTQALPWSGIPATGRTFRVAGIDIFRVVDGKISEIWHSSDHLAMATQLGGKIVPL